MARSVSDPRAAVRISAVVSALAEADTFLSLSKIADSTLLPPSTVHRLLEQLVDIGWVCRGPQRTYGVDTELSRIGALASAKLDIVSIAQPAMQKVVRDCNETCMLGLYMPATLQMVVVSKIDSKYPLKYRPRLNVHRTLLWGASGLAILAWLEDDVVNTLFASAPRRPTNPAIALDIEKTRERILEIRAQGYAIAHGERTRGAVGIAVPILGGPNGVVGDLCLTIPEYRYNPLDLKHYVRLLNEGVKSVARTLGERRFSS